MYKLEKALENVANGSKEVQIDDYEFDLENVRWLMATCCAASSEVIKLNLGSCNLDSEAAEVIASFLKSNSVLTELGLGGNKDIGLLGAKAVAETLCENVALKILWLYECGVGDEGAAHLAVALRQNIMLEELGLGNNGITHVGASALAATIPFNQTLKCLSLDENPLGDNGVQALAKAVPFSGLLMLELFNAELGVFGCTALVEMLKNGSRLRKLGTGSDQWPALDEGFRCNGWLLDEAPEQYLQRNKAMHLQAKKSVYTLLLFRKLRRTALSSFPKEVVREIAQFMYSSRGEISVWQANEQ
jgi:hypothetical protein